MQYAPTIFTTDYRSRVGMLTIICVDTYAVRVGNVFLPTTFACKCWASDNELQRNAREVGVRFASPQPTDLSALRSS